MMRIVIRTRKGKVYRIHEDLILMDRNYNTLLFYRTGEKDELISIPFSHLARLSRDDSPECIERS